METTANNLIEGYKEYVAIHHEKPTSVQALCAYIHTEESSFYPLFASLDALEKGIWLDFFTETYLSITAEEVYENYSVREKMLSFYYTWVEVLKPNRDFIEISWTNWERVEYSPTYLQDFESTFLDYAQQLLEEAQQTEEFADRMFIQNVYPAILWLQARTILRFWAHDKSENFEKTDAMIEKNVNFVCDAFSRSFLDSAFEYLKFVFQAV